MMRPGAKLNSMEVFVRYAKTHLMLAHRAGVKGVQMILVGFQDFHLRGVRGRCLECGAEFTLNSPRQKTCGPRCRLTRALRRRAYLRQRESNRSLRPCGAESR